MMHISHGRWEIECDDCDETFDTEATDKEEAIQTAMNNGWVMSGSYHYCENCAREHEDDKE